MWNVGLVAWNERCEAQRLQLGSRGDEGHDVNLEAILDKQVRGCQLLSSGHASLELERLMVVGQEPRRLPCGLSRQPSGQSTAARPSLGSTIFHSSQLLLLPPLLLSPSPATSPPAEDVRAALVILVATGMCERCFVSHRHCACALLSCGLRPILCLSQRVSCFQ